LTSLPDEIEITPEELIKKIAAGDEISLLDCRESYEWAQMHLKYSVHIPMNEIPSRLNELNPNDQIVVICAHGVRSFAVANWLLQQGYQARSLQGGLASWPTSDA
jgi:rhodanese-related sulfurtransferase